MGTAKGRSLQQVMMIRLVLILACCMIATNAVSYTKQTKIGPVDVVGSLQEKNSGAGGLCDPKVTQHSGYYKIDGQNKTNEHYFYWMFESRSAPKTDPLILWLTGGPGCSGMLALLNENGPCSIEKTASGDLASKNNPYSWTTKANVLWIDQPTGVGFSYGDSGDYDHDEEGVRDDMWHFLQEFFSAHPEYAAQSFYVFGESYGGHYAPNVAYRVWQGNQAGEGSVRINLKGVAVGNGLTDPSVQYQWYGQMAY